MNSLRDKSDVILGGCPMTGMGLIEALFTPDFDTCVNVPKITSASNIMMVPSEK